MKLASLWRASLKIGGFSEKDWPNTHTLKLSPASASWNNTLNIVGPGPDAGQSARTDSGWTRQTSPGIGAQRLGELWLVQMVNSTSSPVPLLARQREQCCLLWPYHTVICPDTTTHTDKVRLLLHVSLSSLTPSNTPSPFSLPCLYHPFLFLLLLASLTLSSSTQLPSLLFL
ncbi:hypothetical protein E2C01_013855 [Portunus trituberculatus]|uniref:Uncharacterized protein n=1 Tax=Portunus trituberculatus TaxID=210409 RepID=A0A5B7DHB5_PORTR|nr:hypothetical protein [Portunus trituberculatus]